MAFTERGIVLPGGMLGTVMFPDAVIGLHIPKEGPAVVADWTWSLEVADGGAGETLVRDRERAMRRIARILT